MKSSLRIPKRYYRECLEDLRRPHPFAFERIGFFRTRPGLGGVLVVTGYIPAHDDEYLPASDVGACLGTEVVRRTIQIILSDGVGLLHVHLHDHNGTPAPSRTDTLGIPPLVEAFSRVSHKCESGFVILSKDRAIGASKIGRGPLQSFKKITSVGGPLGFLSLKLNG